MSIAITYQAAFNCHGEDSLEFLADEAQCAALEYPISDECGKFGQLYNAALDVLLTKFPEPLEGEHFEVMLAGKLSFSQDYYGEVDSYYDVEWSHVEATPIEPEHGTTETVEFA